MRKNHWARSVAPPLPPNGVTRVGALWIDFLAGNRHQSTNDVILSSFDSTCNVSGLGASELDSEAPELRAPEVTLGRPVEGVGDSLSPGPLRNAPIAKPRPPALAAAAGWSTVEARRAWTM